MIQIKHGVDVYDTYMQHLIPQGKGKFRNVLNSEPAYSDEIFLEKPNSITLKLPFKTQLKKFAEADAEKNDLIQSHDFQERFATSLRK